MPRTPRQMKRSPHDGGGGVWQNRIIGEGVEPADQLLANPFNFRIHPKNQQDAMTGVLNQVGWVQRVIVNRRTGHIVDGHLRVSLAISAGAQDVPVIYVDLSEEEEALVLATLDPISAMAATDADKLRELMEMVRDNVEDEMLDRALNQIKGANNILDEFDWRDEWKDMPEFTSEDKAPKRTLYVHFADDKDVEAFARLVKQTITDKTKFIWYPEQAPRTLGEYHAD